VAEGDNAWPYYERAIALLISPNSELQTIPAFQHPDYVEHWEFAGLPDDARRVIGQWIEANRVAWEDFVVAGSKPYLAKSYQVTDGAKEPRLMSVRLPDLSALRNLSRVGVWLSRRDISQGRRAEALEDCLAVAHAGRHWQQSGTVVEQMVALSMVRVAEEEILTIVGGQELSAAELAELQRQVRALYPQRFPLVEVQSEHLVFLDVVQHVFTDKGPGGGHVIPTVTASLLGREMHEDYGDAAENPLLWTTLSLLHAGRDETAAKAEAIFDHQRELSRLSPYEKRARQAISIAQMVTSLPRYRYALVHAMAPGLDRIMELGFRGQGPPRGDADHPGPAAAPCGEKPISCLPGRVGAGRLSRHSAGRPLCGRPPGVQDREPGFRALQSGPQFQGQWWPLRHGPPRTPPHVGGQRRHRLLAGSGATAIDNVATVCTPCHILADTDST
jgi:hypothetical protein